MEGENYEWVCMVEDGYEDGGGSVGELCPQRQATGVCVCVCVCVNEINGMIHWEVSQCHRSLFVLQPLKNWKKDFIF